MNATIHVASIIAVALTTLPASAQGLIWTQMAPVTSPSARHSHAMAYDAARQRVVLFGGYSLAGHFSDTWEWDGNNWLARFPTSYPSVRAYHAMAYDSARQRVVLFGGWNAASFLGDTWEWDGNSWMQRASGPARRMHEMAYDAARQRVVLFGGSAPPGYLGDTWEWDGINWMQRTPASGPSARIGSAMAYDAGRQRVVLFGGYGNTYHLGDTWEWDGINWTQRTPATSPSARISPAMAYDSQRGKTMMFGGNNINDFGDTWEWNGTNWTQLVPVASPPARNAHKMAYDATRQRVVLFGGSAPLGDTWELWTPSVIASATRYGSGCGSPALGFVPHATERPVVGQSGSATIVNAPTSVAAVLMGWSNQFAGPFALPVPLSWIGMPGCNLLHSADIFGLATSPLTPSTLAFSVAIPNVHSLIGSHVYIQAYAFAPGENPLQVVISNGIDWLLGDI